MKLVYLKNREKVQIIYCKATVSGSPVSHSEGRKDDATAQLVMSDITVSTTCLALEGPLSPWGTLMTHTCGHCDNIYTVQCTFQKVSCEKKDKIIQKKMDTH